MSKKTIKFLQKNFGLFFGVLYRDDNVVISLRTQPVHYTGKRIEQFDVCICLSTELNYAYLAIHPLPQETRLRSFLEKKMYIRHVILHRAIAAFTIEEEETLDGKEVHHINGYSLDNRFFNLQVLTPEEHSAIHQGKRARKKAAKETIENDLSFYLVIEYLYPPSPEYITYISRDNRSVSNGDQIPISAIFGIGRRDNLISLEKADFLDYGILNKSANNLFFLLNAFRGRPKILTSQEIQRLSCDKKYHIRTIYRTLDKLIAMRLVLRVSSGRYQITKHGLKKKNRRTGWGK